MKGNLFNDIPALFFEERSEELFETLVQSSDVKVERIISRGHITPEGEWYDQSEDEWVVLLSGKARLLIEGKSSPVVLKPGDHLLLPAHLRHRVEWTDPDVESVWLAVHF